MPEALLPIPFLRYRMLAVTSVSQERCLSLRRASLPFLRCPYFFTTPLPCIAEVPCFPTLSFFRYELLVAELLFSQPARRRNDFKGLMFDCIRELGGELDSSLGTIQFHAQ